jgi:hypothetical protein
MKRKINETDYKHLISIDIPDKPKARFFLGIKKMCSVCKKNIDKNSILIMNIHFSSPYNSLALDYANREICIKCAKSKNKINKFLNLINLKGIKSVSFYYKNI